MKIRVRVIDEHAVCRHAVGKLLADEMIDVVAESGTAKGGLLG